MTFLELLQRALGQKLDEEIDLENTTGSNNTESGGGAGDGVPGDTTTSPDSSDNNKDNEEVETVPTFADGWFDRNNMTFDLSKINGDENKAAIQAIADAMTENNNAVAIERAISNEIRKSNIAVSAATFRRCLDTSGMKVGADGKVTGVTEAFEALRKSDPSLYKKTSKESNPLNEGFNPVDKRTVTSEDELINLAYGQE